MPQDNEAGTTEAGGGGSDYASNFTSGDAEHDILTIGIAHDDLVIEITHDYLTLETEHDYITL